MSCPLCLRKQTALEKPHTYYHICKNSEKLLLYCRFVLLPQIGKAEEPVPSYQVFTYLDTYTDGFCLRFGHTKTPPFLVHQVSENKTEQSVDTFYTVRCKLRCNSTFYILASGSRLGEQMGRVLRTF